MTEQNVYPQQMQTGPGAPRNGLGTAGFVLGLVGLIFSPIPFIGVVAWPLVILGLVFSILGFGRARKGVATNKGLSIAGIVLSAIGLLVCVLWIAVFSKAVNDVNDEANRVATIQYEVTGDAQGSSITYSTFGDGFSQVGEKDRKP